MLVSAVDQTLTELSRVAATAGSPEDRSTASLLHLNLHQASHTIAAGLPATSPWLDRSYARATGFLAQAR